MEQTYSLFAKLFPLAVPLRRMLNDPRGLAPEYREAFTAAEVIFLLDPRRPTDRTSVELLFASDDWQRNMVRNGTRTLEARVFVISCALDSDEPDMAEACCEAWRGTHLYKNLF